MTLAERLAEIEERSKTSVTVPIGWVATDPQILERLIRIEAKLDQLLGEAKDK